MIDRAMPEGARFFAGKSPTWLSDELPRGWNEPPSRSHPSRGRSPMQGVCAAWISFHDPAGNRLEAFYGADTDDTPFSPGRIDLGSPYRPAPGSATPLTVENIDPVMAFYVDVLGFALRLYRKAVSRLFLPHQRAASQPCPDRDRHERHASPHGGAVLLDDVGQSYDIAMTQQDRVSVTLGRHTNDFMTSFYAKTLSSFMIECGWGGRETGSRNLEACEMHHGPSLWGHEAPLPPQDRRSGAREMRMRAAAEGARAPVRVTAQLQADVGDLPMVGWSERQVLTMASFRRSPGRRLRSGRYLTPDAS